MTRPYTLHPSPVTALRHRHGLDRPEAAKRLGISVGMLAVVEMETQRIPRVTLRSIEEMLVPSIAGQAQMTIFDAVAGGDHGSFQGEGR